MPYAVFAAVLMSQTQPALPPVSAVLPIVRNLEIKREAIDQRLGAPVLVKPTEIGGELARYRAEQGAVIEIFYFARGGGQPFDTPFPIHVIFPKGTTGTRAIQRLGFDPRRVRLGRERPKWPKSRFILGHGLRGFDVYWNDSWAKYPTGDLMNPPTGDPYVLFDIKGPGES